LESSKLYTFQKATSARKKSLTSTVVIAGIALLGAVGIDLALNPNAVSTIFSTTSATGTANNGSATGDAVDYEYGTVQLKVTKASGKITAIDLVQAGATAGREAAFSMLVDAAITANGSNISNISGATYTTQAFKTALDSALSKLS
jgi:uncharacterized protein with FMN-binding domain